MRWRRWVAGGVALVAVAGMGSTAWREMHRPAAGDAVGMPAADAPRAAASGATAGGGRPGGTSAAARAAADRSAIAASAVAELAEKASRGTPEIPPEGLDVCGIGHVSAAELRLLAEQPADAPSPIKERGDDLQRRADAALAQVAARLAAGAEHQQVAARLLMGDAEGAAALAERSGDALAYQMALSACAMASRTAPSCARLSSPQWAMLDPSDARPWLRLASEAQRRGDTPRAEAALAEAAARPKLSRGANLLETQVAPVAAVVVPDATLRAHALVRIVGMDAALPGFDVSATLRLCDGESLKLPTRLPLCRTLARQLLAASGDLLEATLSQRLADRVGVPSEQQAYDAATLEAATERFQQKALNVVGLDCASMDRMNEFSSQRAAQSELALALSLLPPKPGR
jgi:hypothetical protein